MYGVTFPKSSVPFYVFLGANIPFILDKTIPFLAHYWSLGVEEQFYLFFPQLAKFSNKFLLRASIVLIFIFILVKLLFWFLERDYNFPLPYKAITVTRFHTMLIGVAGAILYYSNNKYFLLIAIHRLTQIISWAMLLLIAVNKFHIASVIDGELFSIASLFLIMGQVTKRNHVLNLENKACDFIGKISYGIYVIHPLLIFYAGKVIGTFSSEKTIYYFIVYATVIATTILFSYLSYIFFEKKFLKIKEKYATVNSTNTRNSIH